MEKCNGWTNYATWRVNLEVFDQLGLGDFWGYADAMPENVNVYDLSIQLKDYADDLIVENSVDGLARDYARAFLNDVNWYEIASAMVKNEMVPS
jgi:hypothetical protein